MELGRLQEKRVSAGCTGSRNHEAGTAAHLPGEAMKDRHRPGGRRRRQPGTVLRRSWRRASWRLRVATGVTTSALDRERAAELRTPWLGLLLWAVACAGLFTSLLAERFEPAGEPRLAASATPEVMMPMPFRWNSGVDLPSLPATR